MVAMKTWDDLKRASVNDALLYKVAKAVEYGGMSREAALIAAVFALNEMNTMLLKEVQALKAIEIPNILVVGGKP